MLAFPLGSLIITMQDNNPSSGQVRLQGHLRAIGYHGKIDVPIHGNSYSASTIKSFSINKDLHMLYDVALTKVFKYDANGYTELESVDPRVGSTLFSQELVICL